MFDLVAVQDSLKEFHLDGWLFYDFRGANVLARRVMGLDQKPGGAGGSSIMCPRTASRASSCIGSKQAAPDSMPGIKLDLSAVARSRGGSGRIVARKPVAWRWNTHLGFPTRMSRGSTPARSSWSAQFGVEVVSSGDLIQRFEATWDARPAGPPPLPPASGDVIEVERTVNASGNVSLGDRVISAGLPLAGQRVTVRLDGPVTHILSGGVLARTIACPVPQEARSRLRGARTGTAEPPPAP